MKTILYLISIITLVTTSGCVIKERDRGGYPGRPEYGHGEYRHHPDRDWDDHDLPGPERFPGPQHY